MDSLRKNSQLREWFYGNKDRYALTKQLDYYLSSARQLDSGLSKGRDIVVCGMLRSGSTLVFNILREILLHKMKHHQGFYGLERDYRAKGPEDFIPTLWKTHTYSHLLVKRVSAGQSQAFFTHRNLLDSIASQLQKGWIDDLDEFLASTKLKRYVFTSILYDEHPDFTSISYRDLMSEKRAVVGQLFESVIGSRDEEVIERIHQDTEVASVKAKIEELNYDQYDRNLVNHATGLHRDHINDPKIGKWKEVISEADAHKIQQTEAYRIFSEHFNYSGAQQ